MLRIRCPAPFAVVFYEFKCFLSVVSNGFTFPVMVDFGEGPPQYFSIKDDMIVIVKMYSKESEITITAKIISEGLYDAVRVKGNRYSF